MTTRWVCRICVAQNGLWGADLANWPLEGDEEAVAKHIETVHHIPVRREGESEVAAKERFYTSVPTAGPSCECDYCQQAFSGVEP